MKKFYPLKARFHHVMVPARSVQEKQSSSSLRENASLSCVTMIGMGSRTYGRDETARDAQVETLRYGIEQGLALIDTAELYGEGRAQKVVGQAILGRRRRIFLVDKILPSNASPSKMRRALEASLTRLGTDFIDLYLLHWRGSCPLTETITAFENLKNEGLIKNWGVSNFSVTDLEELAMIVSPTQIGANQVLYNLLRRNIEYDLVPWAHQHGLPLMAYAPLEQSRILHYPQLEQVAQNHDVSPAAVALAFILRNKNIVPIVQSSSPAHIDANIKALNLCLDHEDIAVLERVFPPPYQKMPLEMLS